MSQHIVSDYADGQTPKTVASWERRINGADTAEAAAAQIQYLQLLQLRMIKLVLVWTLLILPVLLAVAYVVVGELSDTPSYR